MFQLTPNGLLDSVCMMAMYIIAIYNYVCMKHNKRGTGFVFLILFMLLFSLLYKPEGGDFFGYLEIYRLGVDNPYRHMEDFYYWLMSLIPNNYLLWRVSIWLPAAIIITVIFRWLKIQSSVATTFFLLLALVPSYYYTRNVLALSVLYVALTLFVYKGNSARRTLVIAISIGLMLASWYLHKSMPIYILIALASLFLPFNKKTMLIALIGFPVLYGVISLISSDFLAISEIWISDIGQEYLESHNQLSFNWKGIIALVISYLPIIYFYYIAFRYPVPQTSQDFNHYKVFLYFAFIVFFISFLFFGQGSEAIQGRLYKSSMLPFAFAVCLYFKNYNNTKRCNTFILLLFAKILIGSFLSLTTSI